MRFMVRSHVGKNIIAFSGRAQTSPDNPEVGLLLPLINTFSCSTDSSVNEAC
jgi:hypothetical protein